jgi:hypothetical protein
MAWAALGAWSTSRASASSGFAPWTCSRRSASGARSRWLNSPGMPWKRTTPTGGLATRTRLTRSYAARNHSPSCSAYARTALGRPIRSTRCRSSSAGSSIGSSPAIRCTERTLTPVCSRTNDTWTPAPRGAGPRIASSRRTFLAASTLATLHELVSAARRTFWPQQAGLRPRLSAPDLPESSGQTVRNPQTCGVVFLTRFPRGSCLLCAGSTSQRSIAHARPLSRGQDAEAPRLDPEPVRNAGRGVLGRGIAIVLPGPRTEALLPRRLIRARLLQVPSAMKERRGEMDSQRGAASSGDHGDGLRYPPQHGRTEGRRCTRGGCYESVAEPVRRGGSGDPAIDSA